MYQYPVFVFYCFAWVPFEVPIKKIHYHTYFKINLLVTSYFINFLISEHVIYVMVNNRLLRWKTIPKNHESLTYIKYFKKLLWWYTENLLLKVHYIHPYQRSTYQLFAYSVPPSNFSALNSYLIISYHNMYVYLLFYIVRCDTYRVLFW